MTSQPASTSFLPRLTRCNKRRPRVAAAAPRWRRLLIEPLESRALLALTPTLLDVNRDPVGFPVPISGPVVEVGASVFFASYDGSRSSLWKSDDTGADTALIHDFPSNPSQLTNVNGTLFFIGYESGVWRLWKSDGTTAGTVSVKDFVEAGELANVGGTLFFSASDASATGTELWKSDGTAAGTVLVKDIRPGASSGGQPYSSAPQSLTNVNGTLFFSASKSTNSSELWKSDGTASGTALVSNLNNALVPQYLTNVGGRLFFIGQDASYKSALWTSDGTAPGTTLLMQGSNVGYLQNSITNVNGTAFFVANDGTNGNALWKSNGTVAGTALVKAIAPGTPVNVNGTLFFVANNPAAPGQTLWRSDGTAAGTLPIQGIDSGTNPPRVPYSIGRLVNVNGMLFFPATEDNSSDHELWRSDGTGSGTFSLLGSSTVFQTSGPPLGNVNGKLLFSGPVYGSLLWTSDGTTAGTVILPRPNETQSGYPQNATAVNGTVFFTAQDKAHGRELWKTDGTVAGTLLVKDIAAGSGGSYPSYLVNAGGTLYFSAFDGVSARQLWKTDGTDGGTVLVRDVANRALGPVGVMANLSGALYFSANDGVSGYELWKSDGTPAGTVLVTDLVAGANGSSPRDLTNVNGTLYFSANQGLSSVELWKSDGTAAGTILVQTLPQAHAFGIEPNISEFTNASGVVYFLNTFASFFPIFATNQQLWRTDGTSDGTFLLKASALPPFGPISNSNLANLNGTLFFTAGDVSSPPVEGEAESSVDPYFTFGDVSSPPNLWKTDGTLAGTVQVGVFQASGLIAANDDLFFSSSDQAAGNELWTSDGTASGTVRLLDIFPGASGSYPSQITNANGKLFFVANDGTTGSELWTSDGTPNGTKLVADIQPGSATSNPQNFLLFSKGLIFVADDGAHGQELWSLSLSAPPPMPRLDPIANPLPIQEDAATQSINLTGIAARNGNQLLSVSVKSSNGALIPDPDVTYTNSASTGTLSFKPLADQFGSAVITVTVKDDGGTMDGGIDTITHKFIVSVNPVNDAPTFAKGLNQTAMDEDGPHLVAGWASGLYRGAADESAQKLTFDVVANRPELFAVQPQVDDNRQLTFTPAPNAHGTATITVVLHDDGGTANGGVDVSSPQTFDITITKPHAWHNSLHALDVTGSGDKPDDQVVAGDALAIINYINAFGAGHLPANAQPGSPYLDTVAADGSAHGDDFVVAGDALAVINYINAFGTGHAGPAGEGEGAFQSAEPGFAASFANSPPQTDDWLNLLALDLAVQSRRRRL